LFARSNSPLQKQDLKSWVDEYFREQLEDDDNKLFNGVSDDTIERIYRNVGTKAENNVNSIDPKRADQADPLVLNYYFHQLDNMVKVLRCMKSIL